MSISFSKILLVADCLHVTVSQEGEVVFCLLPESPVLFESWYPGSKAATYLAEMINIRFGKQSF